MEKLSIQILCFIFLIDVVHSCYYEHLPTYDKDFYYTYYETCLAGCCEPFDPGDQKICCDPTGVIGGIAIGVIILFFGLVVCLRIMGQNAIYHSFSHNEREVLIPPPPTYSPATGYSTPSPRIEYSYPQNHIVQANTS